MQKLLIELQLDNLRRDNMIRKAAVRVHSKDVTEMVRKQNIPKFNANGI